MWLKSEVRAAIRTRSTAIYSILDNFLDRRILVMCHFGKYISIEDPDRNNSKKELAARES